MVSLMLPSQKALLYLSYKFSIMADVGLEAQGAMASAAMVLS